MVANTFNPNTPEAGGSLGIPDQLGVRSEFQTSQGYTGKTMSEKRQGWVTTYFQLSLISPILRMSKLAVRPFG